jgi:hypothetical protein
MKRKLRAALVGFAAALLVAQVIPMDRSSPPVESEVPASPEVKAVLQRSCYNCHSNQTEWPWYSRVAPVSWLLAHDVNEGRSLVNYSTWNRLSAVDQAKAVHESWEHVDEGEMPPWYYVPVHPEARLSDRDRELLRTWAEA